MDTATRLCMDVASEVAGRGRRNEGPIWARGENESHETLTRAAVARRYPGGNLVGKGDYGRIGYLVRSKHVMCFFCYRAADSRQEVRVNAVALYRVNIGQYGQDCHGCGQILVKALTEAWPELFTREHCGFVDCKEYTR